jgi:formamidopyrimidine-DNA glycosylase
MPELPEVAFARDGLERWLVGQELVRAAAHPGRVTRGMDLGRFAALADGRITAVARRGKWLTLTSTAPVSLLAHLGMTGKFELQLPGEPPVRWSRAELVRADGAVVHFRDPRQFGRLLLVDSDAIDQSPALLGLGPDAWEPKVTAAVLGARLLGNRRTIKDVLMDQGVIAGLGNIQVTDALFLAGIRPRRRAHRLSRPEIVRLARAIRTSLRRTIAMNKGDKIVYVEETKRRENPFLIYGKAGSPCPTCGTTLRKITIAARTTAYCSRCQA